MGVLDLVAAIAAAVIASSVLFLAHGRHGDDRGGPRAELVRYVGVSALSALVCAVMNALEILGGGTVAAAVGNATNVFAPAMVWALARRLNARAAIGVLSAGAAAILMLGVTFLIPLDEATLVKTAAIAAACLLAAWELRRRPLRDLVGSGVLATTLSLFAVFNLGRLVVAAAAGMYSDAWDAVASAQLTSIVSAVAIVLMGVGTVLMGRQLDDDPAPGTRAFDRGALRREAAELLRTHGRITAVTVRLPEIDLIRRAHNADRAETMMSAIVDAAREAEPRGAAGVPARDTVILLVPGERVGDVDEDVRRAFAARMPGIGYDDTPDLEFAHRRITDVAALSTLMEARRLRPSLREFDDA
ncbi:hypothetical protein [Microbacterium sp. LMI1-1-1.1]|uniref:hypothetical protein n=1 Tax=Microbacterium sp. LMI1-1-1.1 TaxID=3135223 RepID=UPI0034664893